MIKVVVIGPESTGKSTLSEQLARHFHTSWTPEYARYYLEELPRPYEQADLLTMAEGQLALEDQKAAEANNVLICDTDLNVIKVWSEHKYGNCDPRILAHIAERQYDLYLLTYIDVPWEDDPQREHPDPEMRAYFYQVFKNIVENAGVPWVEIKGSFEEREQLAIEAVNKLLASHQI